MGRRHACVPDDVIEDYKPLKLQLELTVGVFRQRLCFKPPQPEICILVPINKELEGTDLVDEQQIIVVMLDAVQDFSRDVWDLFDLHCDAVVLNALNWSKNPLTHKYLVSLLPSDGFS